MKENFDFERKMYLGRYIKNKIRDVVRVFYELTKDEYEALYIYDEYGEDIFEDLFNIVKNYYNIFYVLNVKYKLFFTDITENYWNTDENL